MTATRFPAVCGAAELTARRHVTPSMIRVTLQSDAFGSAWPIQQPGEIITLLFVAPDEPVVLPETGWRFPDGVDQEWRNYTVRRHRPERREIDVDVLLHEPAGPASTWAAAAPLGCDVGFAGPRVDYAPRENAEWLLLCGDDTALPAIAAILEAPPAPGSVLAVIEVAGPDDEHSDIDLPVGADVCGFTAGRGLPERPRTSPTRYASCRFPAARDRSGAPQSPGWHATCEPCCARSVPSSASPSRQRATGCARATGSWTRTSEEAAHPKDRGRRCGPMSAGRKPAERFRYSIREIADRLELARCAVCGGSSGGSVAMVPAAEHPHGVAARVSKARGSASIRARPSRRRPAQRLGAVG